MEEKISATSRVTTERERSDRRLDSFAALLEAGMTCAAVCLVEDELLVTTNSIFSGSRKGKGKSEGLAFLIKALRYFHEFKESGKADLEVEKDLLKYIYCASWQSANKQNVQAKPKITGKMLDLIITYLNKPGRKVSEWKAKTDLTFFARFMDKRQKKLLIDGRNQNNRKEYDRMRSNLNDLQTVMDDVSYFVRHLKKVKSYLHVSGNKIRAFKILAIGAKNEHAEVRILGYLLEKGYLLTDSSSKEPRRIYIGLSKLCCSQCAKSMQIVNSHIKNVEVNLGIADDKELSSENIEDAIGKKIDDEVIAYEYSLVLTGGSHGLAFTWAKAAYAESAIYLPHVKQKMQKSSGDDIPKGPAVWDTDSAYWISVHCDEKDFPLEMRAPLAKAFNNGLKELDQQLKDAKKEKSSEKSKNKPTDDDEKLSSTVRNFFSETSKMIHDASTSSEFESNVDHNVVASFIKMSQERKSKESSEDAEESLSPHDDNKNKL